MQDCASSFPSLLSSPLPRYILIELFCNHLTSHQLIGEATEEMSLDLGQTVSGLLNASFGNAVRHHNTRCNELLSHLSAAQVEIIVGVAALLQGRFMIHVQVL